MCYCMHKFSLIPSNAYVKEIKVFEVVNNAASLPIAFSYTLM